MLIYCYYITFNDQGSLSIFIDTIRKLINFYVAYSITVGSLLFCRRELNMYQKLNSASVHSTEVTDGRVVRAGVSVT